MKLCFSTLGCTDNTLSEVIATAKSFGMDALEIRGLSGVLDNERIPCFSPEENEKTKAALAAAGIRPLVLGTSCSFHDGTRLDAALREGYAALEIAARLGFSAIRVFGDRITDEGEAACVARVTDGVRSLCRSAESLGVGVYLEVHGDFVTEQRLLPIVSRCKDFSCFGLIWDICHTRKSYPDARAFYDRFCGVIRHVHMKDILGEEHVLPGDGTLPIREIADYMTAQGYDGYFSLEWERKWHPALPPIEQALTRYLDLMKPYSEHSYTRENLK